MDPTEGMSKAWVKAYLNAIRAGIDPDEAALYADIFCYATRPR